MTQTFKVGDKVRRIKWASGPWGTLPIGGEGIIKSLSLGGVYGGTMAIEGHGHGHGIDCFELVTEPTDAELAAAYRASMTESRRLFVELEKRGYTIEAMFEGSRRKLRTADSDTRYITKSEIKRAEL